MKRLSLTHLTFLGTDVPDASITFARRATVIHGPSDTGKSFVAEAIDYMLGASSLKEIPQMSGYSTVLLGLRMPTGEDVTLARGLNGGSFRLLQGSVLTSPLPAAVATLHFKHVGGQDTNVSGYLLASLDLNAVRLRTNERNETRPLSFRDVARLSVIDETRIQSEQPPGLSGQYTDATVEFSTLRYFLQAQDDSGLVAVPKTSDRRAASKTKVAVIEQLITSIEDRLRDVADPVQVREQQRRLDATIGMYTSQLTKLDTERRAHLDQIGTMDAARRAVQGRLEELATLQARFELLEQKYTSDLERLELVAESGQLLGLFHPGTCVFCGAEPRHQHPLEHEALDSTQLSIAVQQEQAETAVLREGLRSTIVDLIGERVSLEGRDRQLAQDVAARQQLLLEVEQGLAPQETELTPLLEQRTRVQRQLADYEQVQELTALRASFAAEATTKIKAEPAPELTLRTTADFSRSIVERLTAWGYPDSSLVRYDRTERDLIAGDQARSAHGKGVRAILHAGFTLGLAQFCLQNNLPHPGFVVLDSPLVTYRPPKPGEVDLERETLPRSLVEDFYNDLTQGFDGQVIVLENVSPAESLPPDSIDIEFTKSSNGRIGFFPTT